MAHILPDFLGIGMQKSGTTWLQAMLGQHPDIFLPQREINFFDRNYERLGIEGYASLFEETSSCLRVGEITPAYLWSAQINEHRYNIPEFRIDTPKRVQNMLGTNTQFIVMLRDPVQRAISAYMHHIRKGRIKPDEDILEVGANYGIIDMGFYNAHLQHWLKYFDLKNFMIVSYEWMFEDTSRISKIFNFLDVDPTFVPEKMNNLYNPGIKYELRKDGVFMDKNRKKMKESGEWVKVIDRDQISKLRDIYSNDIEALQSHFAIDTKQWKLSSESQDWRQNLLLKKDELKRSHSKLQNIQNQLTNIASNNN